jgi:hypothetical protein
MRAHCGCDFSRRLTVRCPPPRLAGGMSGLISSRSGSVRSLGQRDRLVEFRGTIEVLAAPLSPAEQNRIGFRLYERFRPYVPEGAPGGAPRG